MMAMVCMVLTLLLLRVKHSVCNYRVMSKKPTPKPQPTKPKFVRLQLMVGDDFGDRVDRWRAKQPGLPNRSEAVRRLVDLALKKDES
jgi:hypothetical protein